MDVSKLPKLSDTQKQQQAEAAAASSEAPLESGAPSSVITAETAPRSDGSRHDVDALASSTADVWISLAIGALLLLMYPRFLQWLSWRLFGTNFNQFLDQNGAIVPYTQVPEFWGDLGPTLFGVVLIVEGLALALMRKRGVMMLAFGLTIIATAYNAIYLIMSFNKYGLAIISAMAVAFGVYIAMYQWKLIKVMSTRAARSA
jgi:hypothetical protein